MVRTAPHSGRSVAFHVRLWVYDRSPKGAGILPVLNELNRHHVKSLEALERGAERSFDFASWESGAMSGAGEWRKGSTCG